MPQKAWIGCLTYGLVSIPVHLIKAADREKLKTHLVYVPAGATAAGVGAAGSDAKVLQFSAEPGQAPKGAVPPVTDQVARVRYALSVGASLERITRRDVYRACDVGSGYYVVLTPSDFETVRAPKAEELKLVNFVETHLIDPTWIEQSYYVVPEHECKKAYSLLHETLTALGSAGIGELPLSGRERVVIVRAGERGLVLHTLYFAHEVRQEHEYAADPTLFSGQELELSKMLVESMSSPTFDISGFKDKYEERLSALVQDRCQSAFPPGESDPPPTLAGIIDMAEALRRSVEAVRKPPASEKRRSAGKRKARRKK